MAAAAGSSNDSDVSAPRAAKRISPMAAQPNYKEQILYYQQQGRADRQEAERGGRD